MKIIKTVACQIPPRADMFLPNWILILGIFLIVSSVIFAAAFVVSLMIGFVFGFVIFAGLGAAAILCWKNQTIRILSESTFEYTTFLGKKTVYSFSQIKDLRQNKDSFTLFVGEGKVHIEACAIFTERLANKIDEALETRNT